MCVNPSEIKCKSFFLLAPRLPPAAIQGEISQRKSRDTRFSIDNAPQGSMCFEEECDSFLLEWKKFSSLALTISIVIAASTHTYCIHNSAGCNKFTPVLRGLLSGILGNIGDNYLKWEVDKVGWGKVAAEKMWILRARHWSTPGMQWLAKLMTSFFAHVGHKGDYLLSILLCLYAPYSLTCASCAMNCCHMPLMAHPVNIWCALIGEYCFRWSFLPNVSCCMRTMHFEFWTTGEKGRQNCPK